MISRGLIFAILVAMTTCLVAPPCLPAQEQKKADDSTTNISGTYSFLREGEFVQVTVEDGEVSGYVSRFGVGETDKDQFIDQFFDKASLHGDHLSFNTKTVHGMWYEFIGEVTKPAGKDPGREGYRILTGVLTEHKTDAKGGDKPHQRQVEFRSFPTDMSKQ